MGRLGFNIKEKLLKFVEVWTFWPSTNKQLFSTNSYVSIVSLNSSIRAKHFSIVSPNSSIRAILFLSYHRIPPFERTELLHFSSDSFFNRITVCGLLPSRFWARLEGFDCTLLHPSSNSSRSSGPSHFHMQNKCEARILHLWTKVVRYERPLAVLSSRTTPPPARSAARPQNALEADVPDAGDGWCCWSGVTARRCR